MKRIVVGLTLIAAGFLGGLLAQPPAPPSGGQGQPRFVPGDFMRRIPFASGTVVSVQGNTVTVQMPFGDEVMTRQVTLTNQTQIQRSQPGTKADIKADAYALVMGQPDPKSGWLRATRVIVTPILPRQANTVIGRIYDVKSNGEQFGVNAFVTVNPNAQIYKMTLAKANDLKQGERIFVQGQPDESGNLVAETVVIGEMPIAIGGFGVPRGGFGGPRGGSGGPPRRSR